MRGIALIAAAVAVATACLPAQAQWKWRDKSGQVHISDLPPPNDIAEKDVLGRPSAASQRPATVAPAASPASARPAAPAASVDPRLEARKKQAEQEQLDAKKAEEARNAETRAENCRRAREGLRSLESGMRITRANEKGEREFLDDKQIAAEQQRARNLIATECK